MGHMGLVTVSMGPLTVTVTPVPRGTRMVAVTRATAIRALMDTKVPTVTRATMATRVLTDTRAATATQVPMVTRTAAATPTAAATGRVPMVTRTAAVTPMPRAMPAPTGTARPAATARTGTALVRCVGERAVHPALPRAHQRLAARCRRGRLPGQREPLRGRRQAVRQAAVVRVADHARRITGRRAR